jgi:hypothetical protein
VSGAFGFNFVSGSKSKQFSDAVCTTIRMAEAATLHCQFATAAYLNKAAFEKMYDGQKGDFLLADSPKNLTPVACDALRRPVLRMAPSIQQIAAPAPAPVETRVFVDNSCSMPATSFKATARGVVKRPAPKAKSCVTK